MDENGQWQGGNAGGGGGGGGGRGAGGPFHGFEGFTRRGGPGMAEGGPFGDIFEQFQREFGGFNAKGQEQQQARGGAGDALRGEDVTVVAPIPFMDAAVGGVREMRVPVTDTCSTCSGSGCKPGTGMVTCSTCGGQGR